MNEFKNVSTIDRPPEAVWPVMSGVMRWPSWTPTVLSVEALAEDDPAVGRSYRVCQPKLMPAVWTITEWKSGESFTWVSKSLGLTATGEHRVESDGKGGSTVTLRVVFEGFLAPVIALLAGPLTRHYVEIEAQSLKEAVEAA